MSRNDRPLKQLLEPVVNAQGLDLEEITVAPAGRRRLLRIIVDADGGVSLDDVAEVSRALSLALDESDLMGNGAYLLEVTSPGVDRPLTEPRHWRRAKGRLVNATLSSGGSVAGRVTAADDDGVELMAEGGEPSRHGFAELTSGRVQVEFRRGDDGDTG